VADRDPAGEIQLVVEDLDGVVSAVAVGVLEDQDAVVSIG
jgi:hypothetical protein